MHLEFCRRFRFRIFKISLNYAPERVDRFIDLRFVLNACCLHKLLLKDLDMKNTELEIMTEIIRDAPNASSNNAMIIRNEIAEYCLSNGNVPW